MIIYLIGNASVKADRAPLVLIPYLKEYTVVEMDPTESFMPEDGSVIIDTITGLDEVKLFRNLDDFAQSPRITVHDYDLLLHLKLLRKLGKIHDVSILGLPPKSKGVIQKVRALLSEIQ